MENASTTLITVEELCEELMIGKNTAYKLLTSGKIKGFRIGRIWKIPRESLNRYLIEQTSILNKKMSLANLRQAPHFNLR